MGPGGSFLLLFPQSSGPAPAVTTAPVPPSLWFFFGQPLAGPVPPVLPADLLAAIKVYFDATASLAGIVGGLRVNRKAKLGASLTDPNVGKTPYAVVSETGSHGEMFTNTFEFHATRIEFRVYANDLDTAQAQGQLLFDAFNKRAFFWQGGQSSPLVRLNRSYKTELMQGVGSKPLDYYCVEFNARVQLPIA